MSETTQSSGKDGNGATAEFVRLLRQHDRQISTFVHASVPSWQDAEDVLQETCVRLWEQFDKYEPDTNFGAWACTVARYMVMAKWEKEKRDRLRFTPELLERIAEEVDRSSERLQDRLDHLAACVEQVSETNRELLSLCYAENMKVKEVAALLRRSANATYLAISRVRKWLHDCVNRRLRQTEVRATR